MSGRSRRLLWASARTAGRSLWSRARALRDPDARSRFWTATGEDWYALLAEMKGAAMKLGQIASQYEDLLPAELTVALKRLQRDATARPLSAMQPVLDSQWSEAQRAQIAGIEETAVAAASIGQVHRGHLQDGRAVAIKLRYPEVSEAVDEDVAALGRLFRMAKVAPVDGKALDAVLEEVRARFREETDYRCELEHLQQLRWANRHDFIRLPEPVPELCTEGVLVTSWQDGASLDEAKAWSQRARDRLGERFVRWIVSQVFDQGFVHADPHPGNFAFDHEGEITVYDFGCAVTVRPEVRQDMAQVVAGALKADWLQVHAALQRLGVVPATRALREQDAELYRAISQAILRPVMAGRYFDFADGRIVDDARAVARENLRAAFDYRPVSELVFVMRTFSGGYWLVRGLKARVRMRALMKAVARKADRPGSASSAQGSAGAE